MRGIILSLSLVLVLVLSFLIVGCHDDNNGSGDAGARALTENDFAEDTALRGDPARGVLVTELEHPDSEAKENDTGDVGVDRIPLSYPDTVKQTFCWEDDDIQAAHFMELLDSEENVVMTVEANGGCVDEIIEPGEYVMSFNHDGRIESSFAIFSEPVSQLAKNSDGLINRLMLAAANLLRGINNSVTKDAEAQAVQDPVYRLLVTRSCVGCDLEGAFLASFDLKVVNLTNANLTKAFMINVDLRAATLIGANLTEAKLEFARLDQINAENADFTKAFLLDAGMDEANFRGANFMQAGLAFAASEFSDFTDANFEKANLFSAEFVFANLTDADFIQADLNLANLQGATLTGANFSRAKWCNRCTCDFESIGTCVGCAPVEEACTGN